MCWITAPSVVVIGGGVVGCNVQTFERAQLGVGLQEGVALDELLHVGQQFLVLLRLHFELGSGCVSQRVVAIVPSL